jgi:curved DNA-binding protein CbpA
MQEEPRSFTDYYSLLNIPFQATDTEIKKAYRLCALEYHPDRHPENPEKYHRMFLLVNEAYQTFTDPALKRAYDEQYRVVMWHKQDVSEESVTEQHETEGWWERNWQRESDSGSWWARNWWWVWLLFAVIRIM